MDQLHVCQRYLQLLEIFHWVHSQIDTYITGNFLCLLCKVITRRNHGGETAFASLLLVFFSIGNLETGEHFALFSSLWIKTNWWNSDSNFHTWLKFSAFSLAWTISVTAASALAFPFISCLYIWRYLIWFSMKTTAFTCISIYLHMCVLFFLFFVLYYLRHWPAQWPSLTFCIQA